MSGTDSKAGGQTTYSCSAKEKLLAKRSNNGSEAQVVQETPAAGLAFSFEFHRLH